MPKKAISEDVALPILKSLTIKFDAIGVPTYLFDGEWHGKDITTVNRLLLREYHKHQRDERRAKV